jgi:hypothetical protein
MSHITHPLTSARSQLRAHWIVALSALLALLATTAVVLVLAIDGGSSTTSSVADQPQPALRTDGGPDESAVAATVGSQPSAGPSESAIAASIGLASQTRTGGPDEANVASSLAQAQADLGQTHGGPDEAVIASSISGR